MKRIFKIIVALFFLLIAAVAGLGAYLHQPYPQLESSPAARAAAEQLAREMLLAVNDSAWQQTMAIAWDMRGSRQLLWDRQRQLARVNWGEYEVLVDLSSQQGKAKKAGEWLSGEENRKAVKEAWSYWCNDSFWLNPISKLFDQGTSLYQVAGRGKRHLLVRYSSGGVTPGDSYLWTVGEDGKPEKWEMWVSLIPIGGMEASWEGWEQLSTGAWLATQHRTPFGLALPVKVVKAGNSLAEVTGGEDPFSPIFAKK